MDRRERIVGGLDLQRLTGLEIGPRHAPLVRKDQGEVLYVDYATTEELRAAWDKPQIIDPATFVEVDLLWGRAPLPSVDYVVASHVIEHVPDLAGWLKELRAALKPGGVVCLAIPDRRFTFDLLRGESTLAEVVEAHLMGYQRPSVRQVFDSYAFTRPNDAVGAWASAPKARLGPIPEKIGRAYAMVEAMLADGRYVDSHCWVFTPRSFLALAEGMHALDWFPFRIARFHPTAVNEHEFVVRLAAEDDSDAITASFRDARTQLERASVPPEELNR
jgi:SAM-dependent methyltransferase